MVLLRRVIGWLLMLALLAPALQQHTRLIKEHALSGAFISTGLPEWSTDSFITESWQKQTEDYLKEHTGFRTPLVKLRNQLHKSLLMESGEAGFVLGKNENYFSINNIYSWCGLDFSGIHFFEERMHKMKVVSDSLRKRGIPLILLVAPGKANLYASEIPASFKPAPGHLTNYTQLIRTARANGIVFTDMHHWFAQIKDTLPQRVIHKTGLHWSVYTQTLVMDSLLRLLKTEAPKPMRSFYVTSRYSQQPSIGDNDAEGPLNLLLKPGTEQYRNPRITYQGSQTNKPRLLCVGDSYFLSFIHTGLADSLFQYEYWYYNNTAYANGKYAYRTVQQDALYWQTIFSSDYILLLNSEVTWGEPGFNFVDHLYTYFTR